MAKKRAEDTSTANGGSTDDTEQEVLSNVMNVVRDCLAKLRAGDLFMDDLEKECYDQLTPATVKDDSGQEKMTKVFKSFLGAVADALVNESTPDADEKVMKKVRKKWMKILKEKFEAIEGAVKEDKLENAASSSQKEPGEPSDAEAEFEDDTETKPRKSKAKDEEMAGADDKNDNHTSENELQDSEDGGGESSELESRSSSKRSKKSSKKSKSKKAKRRAEKKKKKKKKRRTREIEIVEDDDDEGSGAEDDQLLNVNSMSRQEAKEQFEREKEETLSEIPDNVKSRFRECGFATWGKVVYPIIELGPYDVPPGDLRDQWFAMFENCQKSKRAMTRLIYWYGAENLEEAYSFYQASKIVSYEKGVDSNKDKIPHGIQKKIDNDRKLTKTDKQIVKGLEQIAVDAKLEPSERVSWLPTWEEDWEDDDHNVAVEEKEVEEEEEEEEEEEPESPIRPAKKGGKHKKSKGKEDASAKKKKKKKGKKRKKAGDRTDDEEDDANHDQQVEEDVEEDTAPAKKKKSKKTKVLEEPPEPMDFKVASDDEKDEDFSDEASSSSEEEEEYVEPGSGGTKKRKRKDENKPASSRKKKAGDGPKQKREKKQDGDKKKKAPKKNSKAAEQRYFDECEDIFLPLIRELKIAIGADDMKTCELCVMKFQRHVGKTTPPFIRVHQFGLVIKDARKKFKAKGREDLVSLCHELTKDLKKVYAEKMPITPEGFEPKIRRPKKKDLSSAKKRAKVEGPASDDDTEGKKAPASGKNPTEIGQATVVDISKKSIGASAEEQTAKAAPERKAFSLKGLKGMIDGPKKAPPPTKEKMADRVSVPAASQRSGSTTKQLPSWLRGPRAADVNAPESDDRNLAIEFLQDAFFQFPEGKVDVTAASLALESAINDWSVARGDKSDAYWEKTHDIVAAMAGTTGPTPLVQEILEGKYETPRDLLRITRKRINSYVGDYITGQEIS